MELVSAARGLVCKQDLLVGTGEKVTRTIQNWKREPICGTLVGDNCNLQQRQTHSPRALQEPRSLTWVPIRQSLVGELT